MQSVSSTVSQNSCIRFARNSEARDLYQKLSNPAQFKGYPVQAVYCAEITSDVDKSKNLGIHAELHELSPKSPAPKNLGERCCESDHKLISDGVVTWRSRAFEKAFGLTDEEITNISRILSHSATLQYSNYYNAMGLVNIAYCSHSNECLIWCQLPVGENQKVCLNDFLKIPCVVSQFRELGCGHQILVKNIQLLGNVRLRFHRDTFQHDDFYNDEVNVSLLHTCVLKASNAPHRLELGFVREGTQCCADAKELPEALNKPAEATVDFDGNIVSKSEHGSSFNRSFINAPDSLNRKDPVVYQFKTLEESDYTGYAIDQRFLYHSQDGKKTYVVVHGGTAFEPAGIDDQVLNRWNKLRKDKTTRYYTRYFKNDDSKREVMVVRSIAVDHKLVLESSLPRDASASDNTRSKQSNYNESVSDCRQTNRKRKLNE